MPFKKVGPDDYTSPTGRHFNEAQVRLYHANGEKFPGQKTSEKSNERVRKGREAPKSGSGMRRPNSRSR